MSTPSTPSPVELAPLSDIDLSTFIEFLENSDEIRCEATHTFNNDPVCSQKVVARFSWCTNTKLVCQNTVDYLQNVLAENLDNCMICKRSVTECWKVVPV